MFISAHICKSAVLAFTGMLLAAASSFTYASNAGPHPKAIPLPGGEHGLGLDDMGYLPALHRIVVPAGQTGALVLIDPDNNTMTSIPGIAPHVIAKPGRRHRDEGTSSDVYGDGYIFASDHSDRAVAIVDPVHKRVLKRIPLASGSDYVRYLAARQEVWVTEPEAAQIQVFKFSAKPAPTLKPETTISVPGGPEALLFDNARHRAYSNLWKAKTVVMNTVTHKVVTDWPNDCRGGRGLALDAAHSHLFVACTEGAISTLSLTANGKVLAHTKAGAGIDIISYSPALHHLYVPGSRSATLTIFHALPSGALKSLATFPTATRTHCVADDNHGHVYVCNPHAGGVLFIDDKH